MGRPPAPYKAVNVEMPDKSGIREPRPTRVPTCARRLRERSNFGPQHACRLETRAHDTVMTCALPQQQELALPRGVRAD